MIFLFMTELMTAVLQHNKFFYPFDCDCRDINGEGVTDVTSVLIKSESLLKM